MKKPQRKANTTVLIIGEGDTEKAFLEHLKSIYVPRGCGVSVKVLNAHGKGPNHVVDVAVRQLGIADYSIVAVLMDTDLAWTATVRTQAKRHRLVLIGATPCCDGLLLGIAGKNVPHQSEQCKQALKQLLGCKPLQPSAYTAAFNKPLLDQQRSNIPSLEKLLTLFSGMRPNSD